jgi:Asp-tRNA(Asn)/Glu-tRNA(Gln) amidotransferase A subunit family amidase
MHEAKAIDVAWSTAADIAAAVAAGRSTAESIVAAALARIRERGPQFNAFTVVTEERALARARALDEARARRDALPPLAGVPFAVKNLFDIAGLTTLAGAKINRDAPPAKRDATIIRRLEAAGAVLVGALNMGEYAYDFTGENMHYGPSHNPIDPRARLAERLVWAQAHLRTVKPRGNFSVRCEPRSYGTAGADDA